jgi:hypothetical protein
VRDDQADPSDHARDRHRCRRGERRRDDDRDAKARGVEAEGARLVVGKREEVHAPAQERQRCETERDQRKRRREIARQHAGEASEQPEGDRRQLVVRIGHVLRERHARSEERADHDSGEHQREHPVVSAHPGGDREHQSHGGKPAREGEPLDGGDRQSEEDAGDRAERAAAGNAEDVGRDQRIAKQALVGRARRRERRADRERGDHARTAHLQHDRANVVRKAVVRSAERRPEHAQHVARRDRKAAHGHARRGHEQEHRHRSHQGSRKPRANGGHAGHSSKIRA